MAYIEIRYCCPVCNKKYAKQNGAIKCRNTHPVLEEKWAVGNGSKSVRIFNNTEEEWALKEADLSDFIEERKKQLDIK